MIKDPVMNAEERVEALEAEIERLRALKTPASQQLLNITKGMLDHAEAEIERLKDELSGTIKVREQAFERITNLTADLAAERDLVQRLADALNCFDYDGHGKFLATFGLRKVEGRWVKVNG